MEQHEQISPEKLRKLAEDATGMTVEAQRERNRGTPREVSEKMFEILKNETETSHQEVTVICDLVALYCLANAHIYKDSEDMEECAIGLFHLLGRTSLENLKRTIKRAKEKGVFEIAETAFKLQRRMNTE